MKPMPEERRAQVLRSMKPARRRNHHLRSGPVDPDGRTEALSRYQRASLKKFEPKISAPVEDRIALRALGMNLPDIFIYNALTHGGSKAMPKMRFPSTPYSKPVLPTHIPAQTAPPGQRFLPQDKKGDTPLRDINKKLNRRLSYNPESAVCPARDTSSHGVAIAATTSTDDATLNDEQSYQLGTVSTPSSGSVSDDAAGPPAAEQLEAGEY